MSPRLQKVIHIIIINAAFLMPSATVAAPQMQEALHIALVGMGYVFFFLCLLIFLLSAMSYVLRSFFTAKPQPGAQIPPNHQASQSNNATTDVHLTVATAAVEHHIKASKTPPPPQKGKSPKGK